jgi:hypothetical protein
MLKAILIIFLFAAFVWLPIAYQLETAMKEKLKHVQSLSGRKRSAKSTAKPR